MYFSEEVFIWSLINRPEDTKIFRQIFDPKWLQTVAYRPILEEIFTFCDRHKVPPSFKTLHQVFKDRDEALYTARYKKPLEEIAGIEPPDLSEIVYHLDNAKQAAITWSFKELTESAALMKLTEDISGDDILGVVNSWASKFLGKSEDVEMNIKEAFKDLLDKGWLTGEAQIPCNIDIIDEITGNGLRPKQLGIIIAPTGHGKSTCLIIMSYNFSSIENKNTLFITNEISMEEVAERFLSKISKTKLDEVIRDPVLGYKGIDRLFEGKEGLENKLKLVEVNREIDANDLEAMIYRYKLNNWHPEVVVIDFMERMKPIASGVKRDQTWNWYGAIAQDLVRLSKKLNVLIWTAGQTNRAGLTAQELDLSMTQGSIRHLQEATAVISMHQNDNVEISDPEVKVLAFKSLKARQNKRLGKTIHVKARLGKMEITNDRIDIAEMISKDDKNSQGTGWSTK